MEKLFRNTGNQSFGVEQKKVYQKKQILRTLFFHGAMSNSVLSAIVQLSTPKINSLLIELIEDGLVRELGMGDSSGGRRPVIYGLVEESFYVAGISVNINRTIVAVFDSNRKQIGMPGFLPVKMHNDFGIFSEISAFFEQFLAEKGIEREKVLTVGVELPGLFNEKQDINKTYFPEVKHLTDKLQHLFGPPVFICHDSKLRAFAEQHFGIAKNRQNVLVLQADWGLGLGIIINGELYPGKSGYSGEFGHLPIVDNGVLCSCGKQGCLETIVSATAIARRAAEGIRNGETSLIKELVDNDPEKIDISVVIDAANRGDQYAISIFSDVGYWLGKGIVYLIQIFNPELIVIGGHVAEANQFISASIQQTINIFSNRDISNDTEILFSELGSKAGPLGVAAFALDKLSMEKTF